MDAITTEVTLETSFLTFSHRLYPIVQSNKEQLQPEPGDAQYLAVSHSGIRLVRREKSLPTDYLQVGCISFILCDCRAHFFWCGVLYLILHNYFHHDYIYTNALPWETSLKSIDLDHTNDKLHGQRQLFV